VVLLVEDEGHSGQLCAIEHDEDPEDRNVEAEYRSSWDGPRRIEEVRETAFAFFECRLFEHRRLEDGGGAIVDVSSHAGIRGSPERTPYSASKHGVIGLTRSVALEYADEGLRANAVCPMIVETPAIASMSPEEREEVTAGVPMGWPADSEEVASAIVWLCSAEASFVTGHTMPVDGGQTRQ
jgi:NAD(P)-dependent dehydrogenase (short-subunit alcohol dehydrogenase family)